MARDHTVRTNPEIIRAIIHDRFCKAAEDDACADLTSLLDQLETAVADETSRTRRCIDCS